MWDQRLQHIKAVIQRHPGMTTERHDRRLSASASMRVVERGVFGPVFRSSTVTRLRHFASVPGLVPNSRGHMARPSQLANGEIHTRTFVRLAPSSDFRHSFFQLDHRSWRPADPSVRPRQSPRLERLAVEGALLPLAPVVQQAPAAWLLPQPGKPGSKALSLPPQ